jgi:hypothetical protein
VYAGAMLPKAYTLLDSIFKSISQNLEIFEKVEFQFIGTGKTPNDPEGYNIKPFAQQYGLWNKIVFEYPRRIPYLDVLVHLESSDGVFILGSTEPHYSPSKVYQAVLSQKPIFAVLHNNSSAVKVINESSAGLVLSFNGENDVTEIAKNFPIMMNSFKQYIKVYKPSMVNRAFFETYSAKSVTKTLVDLITTVL